MRSCPSVEGSAPPLITHRIGVDVCLARQRTFFHKCHRCIYRDQPAGWEPPTAPMPMLEVHAASELRSVPVKTVEIARPAARKASGGKKAARNHKRAEAPA
jgi:hypothetical protein